MKVRLVLIAEFVTRQRDESKAKDAMYDNLDEFLASSDPWEAVPEITIQRASREDLEEAAEKGALLPTPCAYRAKKTKLRKVTV